MFSSRLEFKGAVIGMILGDGCLPKIQRGTNNHFTMTHSIKQKEYALHKKELLEYLTGCRVYESLQKSKHIGDHEVIRVDTRVHPLYTKLYSHMYHLGRRTVDEHVMKCLTPLGLALWYQDDGTLTNHEGFLTPFLCVSAYNRAECELMSRELQKKFGLQWRVNSRGKYFSLRLRRKDRESFFELIKEYIVPCMKYKVAIEDSSDEKRVGLQAEA